MACSGIIVTGFSTSTLHPRSKAIFVCSKWRPDGVNINTKCKSCSGNGRVRNNRKLAVTIPAGIEDNSKIFLVKKISFDKKKRKLIISKYKQDKSYEVPAKDIVLDEIKLEGKKVDKLEIQFSHVDFWSFLIKEYNILSIEDFITSAIEYYNIKNYDHLNIFLESFNSDFTYYKVVDKDKVYLNPKDIVSKILNNLDIKKQKDDLSKDFIRALNENHNLDNVDWAKYNEQIAQIINYLAGEKKYSRTFIESVKDALGANNYLEILSLLKSDGTYLRTLSPSTLTHFINFQKEVSIDDIVLISSPSLSIFNISMMLFSFKIFSRHLFISTTSHFSFPM